MIWIKIDETLPDHPKVYDLAAALKIDRDEATGKLVRLWIWMLVNREDGQFSRRDGARIAEVMRCKAKPDKLIAALAGAGLVDETGEGYRIHDWEDYAGALLTQRKKTRERVTKHRQKAKEAVTETHGDEPLRNGYVTENETQNEALRNGVREEKRREENNKDDDDGSDARARGNVDYSLIRLRAAEHYREAWGRQPTEAELDAAVRWYCMGSPEELIWEAYRRAAMANAKSAFGYASACLEEWDTLGIRTMADLAAADYEREEKRL